MLALASLAVSPFVFLIAQDQDIEAGRRPTPPPAPLLGTHPGATRAGSIVISGRAPRATRVEVVGHHGIISVPLQESGQLREGEFSVLVPLVENSVNTLFFFSVSHGVKSAATATTVVQDLQAPLLLIDLPAVGVIETPLSPGSPRVDVLGRVGDTLSGFQGLKVTVNGESADVNIGIGTNGTFVLTDVPIQRDAMTAIEVTAMDALGNISVDRRTIEHRTIPVDTPFFFALSGNGQSGPTRTELGSPIRVKVLRGDGSSFAQKVVTFRVSRSDGLLAGSQGGPGAILYQVRTGGDGIAEAWWTLGSDAGSGNNRVTVTSEGVSGTVGFCATAHGGSPQLIAVGSGDLQRGETGSQAVAPLRIFLHDGQNGVAGEPVIFTVVRGGGRVDGEDMAVVDTDQTGHAEVRFVFGAHPGANVVEATFTANPGVPVRFHLKGVERGAGPTRFSGIVQDNAERPLQGATVSLSLPGAELETSTDSEGQFRFENMSTTGPGHLHVDGSTVTAVAGELVPPGSFPALEYAVLVVPEVENDLPTPVLLPPLEPANTQPFNGTADVTLTIKMQDPMSGQIVTAIEGLEFFVDSETIVTLPNGTKYGHGFPGSVSLSLNAVHADKIPMPMPDGAAPPIAWTLGPGGAHFDPPIRVKMPNMGGLAPGASGFILSFDHDIGMFVIVSSAHVTEDGQSLVSDERSGIDKAGWGGFCPPYPFPGVVIREPEDKCKFGQYEKPTRHSPLAAPKPEVRTEDYSDRAKEMNGSNASGFGGSHGEHGVYYFNGEFFVEAEDLRIKGQGFDFVWGRKYRSKLGPSTSQGAKWDFSYNVYIEQRPEGIRLHDGNSREDLYEPVTMDGPWCTKGFHREIVRNQNGTYTLTFADKSTWTFSDPAIVTFGGTLQSVKDRNGNEMTFTYGFAAGIPVLTTITDTLGNDITIEHYLADSPYPGLIKKVVDHTGREVVYTYYNDGDAEGSFADLKTASLPATADYGSPRTTTYRYKPDTEPPLSHFMVSITDPENQQYVTNEYFEDPPITEQGIFLNGRIKRQRLGLGSDDWLTLSYKDMAPGMTLEPIIDRPTVRSTVIDRNGNKTEYFYDDCNREHMRRVHTRGLHPGEPAYYETKYEWNDDYLMTKMTEPDGSVVEYIYESDLRPSAPARARANLRVKIERQAGGPASDQSSIKTQYFYDSTASAPVQGGGGFNFLTRQVDGNGNTTTHTYDSNGNRMHTSHPDGGSEDFTYNGFGQMETHTLPSNGSSRRRDRFEYTDGYLSAEIIGDNADSQRSEFDRNDVGVITKITDPRGMATSFIVNALDQVTKEIWDEGGFAYERNYTYDGNNNITEIRVTNEDDQGSHPDLSTFFTYDELNYPLTQRREVGFGFPETLTTYGYDGNRNQNRIQLPEGNVTQRTYDERNLLAREEKPLGLTIEYDYDAKGNLKRRTEGSGQDSQVTEHVYDSYDRLVKTTDPMGNTTENEYDKNGNVLNSVKRGQLVDTPSGGSTRLWEGNYEYDERNRRTEERIAFFDVDSGGSLGSGEAVTITDYAHGGQVLEVTNPNDHDTTTTYDGNDREFETTDAKNNVVRKQYDDNSNLVTLTEIERSDGGGPSQTFVTSYQYDPLDRLTHETNNIGQTMEYRYDSRNNQTLVIDREGNSMRSEYDGLNRLFRTTRFLTSSPDIVTEQDWDRNSNLTAQEDGNGNRTTYEYDDLDRRKVTRMADGTEHRVMTYDVHGNPLVMVDANGTQVTATYDKLNRVETRTILRAPGVLGTTSESYEYDGLSRLGRAANDFPEGLPTVVERDYDSLGNVVRERLNGIETECVYDAAGNMTDLFYPGGRKIHCEYDELERKERILENNGPDPEAWPLIADFDFLGPARVERRTNGNGTVMTRVYDGIANVPGDFGVKRVVETKHVFVPQTGPKVVLDHRTYRWDKMYNKTQRKDIRAGGPGFTHDYQYDDIYRLVHTLVTDLQASVVRDETYDLDKVGNRDTVLGGSHPGDYTCVPTDCQVNQYTATPFDARQYDANGNLTVIDDGLPTEKEISYDYLNRIVLYADDTAGQQSMYLYDALGRRVLKVEAQGTSSVETAFIYSGVRVVEERDDSGQPEATYVYGHYVDEVIEMTRNASASYYHADDMHNVQTITSSLGAVQERFEYGDYGQLVDASTLHEVMGPASSTGNPYFFVGARMDTETGLYYLKTRYFDPVGGRFATRDPLGIWEDPSSIGNGYVYAGNNPWTLADPYGTFSLKDIGSVVLDFVPVVGAGKGIYESYQAGSVSGIALNAAFLALDVATLGSSSVVRTAAAKAFTRSSAIPQALTARSLGALREGAKSFPTEVVENTVYDNLLKHYGKPGIVGSGNVFDVLQAEQRFGVAIRSKAGHAGHVENAYRTLKKQVQKQGLTDELESFSNILAEGIAPIIKADGPASLLPGALKEVQPLNRLDIIPPIASPVAREGVEEMLNNDPSASEAANQGGGGVQ